MAKLEDVSIKHMAGFLTVVAPLWAAIAFGFHYEANLVKKVDIEQMVIKPELAAKDLDARIERTEILIAIYARDVEALSEDDKNDYSRAKARLLNLEEQRDKLMGVMQ